MTDRVFGARTSDIKPTLLVGASPAIITPVGSAPIVDLRKYCTYVDNQFGSQCVGEAIVGANLVACKGQGKRGSHVGVYVGARVRERNRKGDAIPDVGCMPADGYDHIVAVGIEPLDARDLDPSKINTTDTWDEAVSAKKVPMEFLVPLEDGDLNGLDSALAAEWPATYTQEVDQSYLDLRSSNPVWTGLRGPSLGKHRQAIVGRIMVTGIPCIVIFGSWGTGWADGGFSYLPEDVFYGCAEEVVLHRGGVVL